MDKKLSIIFKEHIIFKLSYSSNDDIELILCYESLSGNVGCISCPSFGIEHEGNLYEYPFIKYTKEILYQNDNANIEQIAATSLSHIKSVSICLLNYGNIINGRPFDFSTIDGELKIICDTVEDRESIGFRIKNSTECDVYLCCMLFSENNQLYVQEEHKAFSCEDATNNILGFNTICN